jgi:opacity protein-like surface antigen
VFWDVLVFCTCSGAAALAASLKAAADATAAANRRRQRLLHSKPGINKSQNSYSKYARSFNAVVGNKSGSDSSRSSSSSSSDDEEDAFGLGGSCSWLSNSESSSSLSGSDNDEAEKDANAFKSLPSPSFSALVHLDLRDNGLGAAAEAMVARAASEHPTLQRGLLQV